jgi:hypothetical protein
LLIRTVIVLWFTAFLLFTPQTVIAQPKVTPIAITSNSEPLGPAKPVEAPKPAPKPLPTKPAPKPGCEQYREIVQKYFGPELTDTALFVASKESGCNQNAVSPTADYCLFQINREPATRNDLELCVRRAWEKYVGGRVGEYNWSAWYAVCTPKAEPKYPGIKCR